MPTRRPLVTLAVAAALAIPTAAAASPQGSSAPRWTPTATRAVHLGRPSLGALDGATQMRITVGLRVRHKVEMDRLAEAVSTPGSREFGRFLRPSGVRARFGPTSSAVSAVTHWLRDSGFRSLRISDNGLLIGAQADAAAVQRAFHTRLERYRLNGQTVFANTTDAMVPAALHGVVASVLGLSNLPLGLPHVLASGGINLAGFSPTQVAKIYDASTLPPARHSSVAVVMMGDPTKIIANLRTAEAKWHYPRVPVSIEYGGPKTAITENNPLSGNAEWDLDTQMATLEAVSPQRLYIYDEQTFTDQDVVRGINSFVADDKAVSGSVSVGECDYIAWVDGAMLVTDESLEEGALQGQSFFAGTGDNGSFCPEVTATGLPGGGPGTSWPADGTWTTAAGGTTVLADDAGNVNQEIAWIGGGGGVTPLETAGDWTIPTNAPSQMDLFFNQGGRSVPDISADADPNTPVLIYTGGKTPSGIGGTSVSGPLLSGLWVRMQGVSHNRLGDAAIRFYNLYDQANPGETVDAVLTPVTAPAAAPKPVAGFRDVVLGGNGLFVATPGYDYTTGIGTPLASTLVKRLQAAGGRGGESP